MTSGQSEVSPPPAVLPHPPAPPPSSFGRSLLGWAGRNCWFLGCVALLAVFTIAFEVQFRDNIIRKLALPLKRELSQLDRDKLTYTDPATGKTFMYDLAGNPVQLPPEMVNELGTDQYLSWPLVLMSVEENQAGGRPAEEPFQVFVTYYTGKPDQVPHVPEQCMLGNGYRQVGNRLVTVDLPGLPEKDRRVPLQALLFHRRTLMDEESRLVMYTFRVCDEWHADRDGVRMALGNPRALYAYFSKVEVSLGLPPAMPPEAVAKATEAGKRFLQTALPVLVQDHWPAWPSTDSEIAGQ